MFDLLLHAQSAELFYYLILSASRMTLFSICIILIKNSQWNGTRSLNGRGRREL
ncbi:hypothetical protein BDV37DRAFT_267254 [Aspergillus pseudonomiae]|uniref:Uncharacterized protein n=1 Tax=Aspergillus pseudonomiae TaxID=1506151 RepID=A0A5N7CT89_9EURO|nr:uncharacterized protein BDV37DRAFT_267254 [Aspergillus pseudonomiae]KAE8396838.1 hypothetical protein BDV37DRAFT_267254 [Aspergillus pseudonomiae]